VRCCCLFISIWPKPQQTILTRSAEEEGIVRLLQSLGLSSTLLSDGHSPINLFNTATKLVERK
jgi:hypothetical protein